MSRFVASLLMVVVAPLGVPAQASESAGGVAGVTRDCHERLFIGAGLEEELRKPGGVPMRYTLRRDTNGPLLFVAGIHCADADLGAVTETENPLTIALFEALIDPPQGQECLTDTCFDFYILSRAMDRRNVVDWFREGSTGYPATFVPGLELQRFSSSVGTAERFTFRAPHPTSSPFALEGTAREGLPVQSVTVRWWWEGADGGVTKVTFRSDSFSFGDIDVSLTASRRSDMSRLFGAETPQESTVFTSLGGIRWVRGELERKEMFPAS